MDERPAMDEEKKVGRRRMCTNLHHGEDPDAASGGADADGGAERAAADGAVEPEVV
jgi:hypothetical protein